LYTTLDNDLASFNTTLNSQWNGVKYPVIFSSQLWDANANTGPQLVNAAALAAVQAQLQELKATGVEGVSVEVGFPMLYEPFFASQSQYQQFVTFYQNVAASVRAQGLKLIVLNTCLWNSGHVLEGWPNIGPFYASLNWTAYQQARAQTAAVIAQTMQPDYMSVMAEPDTEATMSGQSSIDTVAGATSMLTQILSSVEAAGVSGMKVGAGVGSWLPQSQQFIQSFVTLPLDFIDMHVLPVNESFLPNALTLAGIAGAAGKPVTMTQIWLRKVRDDELNTVDPSVLMARDPFSFWAPLDAYFLQTMENLAYYKQMAFISVAEPIMLWAYMTYGPDTENLTPTEMMSQEGQLSNTNMLAASFTSTAMSYYSGILPVPDTAPPSSPGNLAGVSGQPTQAHLTWNASTDNVGVAGYYVYRNGVKVATIAQPSYSDTGLTNATTYSYFVEAFDLAGNISAPSLTVPVTTWNSIPPVAPTNVAGKTVSTQQINLTWSPATAKIAISSYRVFRGTAANNLTQVATTYSTPTSYTNYYLTPSTKYYYGVEAVDTDGNVSPMSAVVSVTTLALPSPPSKLTAKPVSTIAMQLTWSAGASGLPVAGYNVFRGSAPSSLVQIAGKGSATSYEDYPLTPGTTYYYAIEEVDQDGNVSPMSATASGATLALPSPPASVTAVAISKAQVLVTWTAAQSGMPLAHYRVYRGTSPSNLIQLTVLGPTSLSLNNYSVTPGTTFYYGIESADSLGNVSPMSALAQVTTPN
jgi:chitodextrinase